MSRFDDDAVIVLGDLELTRGRDQGITGKTASDIDTTGVARSWWIRGSDEVLLLLADVDWDTGERDLRIIDRAHSPQRYDRLTHGLRLGVHEHGDDRFVELRQNRLQTTGWSGLHRASLDVLSEGAGLNAEEALLDAGAIAAGSRADVLDDTGRRRAETCALFPAGELRAPAVAYVISRVLPLHHGVREDG